MILLYRAEDIWRHLLSGMTHTLCRSAGPAQVIIHPMLIFSLCAGVNIFVRLLFLLYLYGGQTVSGLSQQTRDVHPMLDQHRMLRNVSLKCCDIYIDISDDLLQKSFGKNNGSHPRIAFKFDATVTADYIYSLKR